MPHPNGRWPANFVLGHHPDCGDECYADCPVYGLGQQSGQRPAGGSKTGLEPSKPGKNVYSGGWQRTSFGGYDDEGTAARFFFRAGWNLERVDPVFYCSKASAVERDAGLGANNPHPTVKPIALTQWLATLLLPPERYAPRRLLVPFAGVASEMIGAALAGWDVVVGVELGREHVAIGKARLAWWCAWAEQSGVTSPGELLDIGRASEAVECEANETGQLGLW